MYKLLHYTVGCQWPLSMGLDTFPCSIALRGWVVLYICRWTLVLVVSTLVTFCNILSSFRSPLITPCLIHDYPQDLGGPGNKLKWLTHFSKMRFVSLSKHRSSLYWFVPKFEVDPSDRKRFDPNKEMYTRYLSLCFRRSGITLKRNFLV